MIEGMPSMHTAVGLSSAPFAERILLCPGVADHRGLSRAQLLWLPDKDDFAQRPGPEDAQHKR